MGGGGLVGFQAAVEVGGPGRVAGSARYPAHVATGYAMDGLQGVSKFGEEPLGGNRFGDDEVLGRP